MFLRALPLKVARALSSYYALHSKSGKKNIEIEISDKIIVTFEN